MRLVFVAVLSLCLCSSLGCATDSVTGEKSIDAAKVAKYVSYVKTFNAALVVAADTAAALSPSTEVQAGVLAAKAAIAVADASVDKLNALAQASSTTSTSTSASASVVAEAVAQTQGAVEAANAATGVATASTATR